MLAELCRACGGRSALGRLGGTDLLAEWDSLSRETRAEDFFEALLGLAHRQEQVGHLEIAIQIYAAAVGAVRERPLRIRAQHHLDAMLGRGAAGPRAEFLLRNLAQQASDPAMILGMGAAGAVFRMTRTAMLSRLALSPTANFMTRGLGARLSAGTVGFLAEAPAFTAATRLGNAALGREQDWSGSGLWQEFAGGALTLLGLKVFGGLSGLALRRWAQTPGTSSALLRGLLPQTALLSGILVSHRLEEGVGLRPHRDDATEFTDAFATLLQFHAGGRLAHHAFGEAWQRGDRLLDQQGEALLLPRIPDLVPNALPTLAFSEGNETTVRPNLIFSMMMGSGRGRRARGATVTGQLDLPYGGSPEPVAKPRARSDLPGNLPLDLRLAETARQADPSVLHSSLRYLARKGRALTVRERIFWIRTHRLPGGIPLLGEAFRSQGSDSTAALGGLREFAATHRSEVIAELRPSLRHPQLLTVAPVLDALVALRATEALPELRDLSAAFPAPLAILAETARVDLGDAEMIPLLRSRAFQWQRSAVDRITYLEALGRLGEVEAVVPELRNFFRNSRVVYFRAGLALSRLGHGAAIPNPAAMIDQASSLERAELAEAHWATGRRGQALELWGPLLNSGDRVASLRVLARARELRLFELLPALRRLHSDSANSESRSRAAETLIEIYRDRGDAAALEGLLGAVEPASLQTTERLQIAAARARLSLGANAAATERLETYLASHHPAHRLLAAEGLLSGSEPEAARRSLEAMFQDGNFEIRNRAFALWNRHRASVPPGSASALAGNLSALLTLISGVSVLLHPALAEAAFQVPTAAGSSDGAISVGLASMAAGVGVAMMLGGRGGNEGPRRGSDRPVPPQMLGWFEQLPNSEGVVSEDRFYLAPLPPTPVGNQRFIAPPAPGAELTIGRETAQAYNLFPAELRNISRRHMDLRLHEGRVEVRVHNGSRGLRINGRNLAPFQWYELRDRDAVEFVAEGGLDILGVEPNEEAPGEYIVATRRLGRFPQEARDAPAIFVFRLPRPAVEPAPRRRRNLLERAGDLLGIGVIEPSAAAEPEARDSRPTAAFHDPLEVFAEIRRLSSEVSDPMPLLEGTLREPYWQNANQPNSAAIRRDVLGGLLRIHRRLCGNAETVITLQGQAPGITASHNEAPELPIQTTASALRLSTQSLRVPHWDGVLRQRLETYRQGLEQLRRRQGSFPMLEPALQELNLITDRLNRLFELVRLYRRGFSDPAELAQFDAIEGAYRGLRAEVFAEGQRVRSDTRGLDVTVRRQQRELWAEEFATAGRPSRAVVNMRILMGDIREVHGIPVAGSLFGTLSGSTLYEGNRSVRVHFDADGGQIVAFEDGHAPSRRAVDLHRSHGRRIEEAVFAVDAQASGRITDVAVLGEVRDSIRESLVWLQGLRVLPPQRVTGFTGYAGEPETRGFQLDLIPDFDAPADRWYRVEGLVLQTRPGWALVTLEPHHPELGLPGIQLWIPSLEVLDLSLGDPVTAQPLP